MTRRFQLTALLALAFLMGCTPPSENIVRRTHSAAEEGGHPNVPIHAGQADGASLDPSTHRIISRYGQSIKEYASQYGFDWRLILAIMKQESGFEADAESQRGASGLMQVMPVTQKEVADRLDIESSNYAASNIRIGVYYLRTLHEMFRGANEADRLKLTLASYNAGLGRILDAQEIAAYLGDNPVRWQAVRESLPLLSRRFASLHQHVWADEHPHNGHFGGAKQTVAYVDSVIAHYETYLRCLN